LFTGRRMSATEAASLGLVNHVVEPARVLDEAMALAGRICGAAPLALAAIKQVLRATEGQGIEAAYRTLRGGLPAYDAMLRSKDAQEGPRAFVEKRSPVWRGC
jgi:crotonobetainyl-CoA hydratase